MEDFSAHQSEEFLGTRFIWTDNEVEKWWNKVKDLSWSPHQHLFSAYDTDFSPHPHLPFWGGKWPKASLS